MLWTLVTIVTVIGVMFLFAYQKKIRNMKTVPHKGMEKHKVHHVSEHHQRLDHFVKTHLGKGHSRDAIKKSLTDVGWDNHTIEESLRKHGK